MKVISVLLAVVGVLLAIVALVGRFHSDSCVFGTVVEGGISAGSIMLGANTFFVLAVLARLMQKKE
jgi:hypothetical protein